MQETVLGDDAAVLTTSHMVCPACSKEISVDGFFCQWCNRFVVAPHRGVKAGLFGRWVALMIDPLIAIVVYAGSLLALESVAGEWAGAWAILLALVYVVVFLLMLRRGTTPGKLLMGLQVVRTTSGSIPGFGVMFVREVVGRFVSGLFLGLGYFWAIFDRSGQAWHDKIANTVVVRTR